MVTVQVAELADTEAAGEEELEDGFVAQADGVFGINGVDDPLSLFTSQETNLFSLHLRQLDLLGGKGFELSL